MAVFAAEKVFFAFAGYIKLGCFLIHFHSANWVFCHFKLQIIIYIYLLSLNQFRHCKSYLAVHPPSTTRLCPVMKLDSSNARKTAALPMSSGFPNLPTGVLAISDSLVALSPSMPFVISVTITPGFIAFTVIPFFA